MKKGLILICLFCCQLSFSQRVVWDAACMETLIANHKAQNASFTSVKNNESAIAVVQKQISEKMVQVEYFQNQFYKSLKSVDAILKQGKDVLYCGSITADIAKYQRLIVQMAGNDPALILVGAKTELTLATKTADLSKYIYQVAIIGTDVNLMDNKQRLDLLKHVIDELREMRAVAFSIYLQMRTAKRNGVFKTLFPANFKYKDNRSKLATQILNDYKLNPKH